MQDDFSILPSPGQADCGRPSQKTNNMNTSHPYDLVIGLDRSDKKADLHLITTATGQRRAQTIDTAPEALWEWLLEPRQQHPQARVALCLEQPAVHLIAFLEAYDWITLYPINPITLQKFREAFVTSRAKDDALDAQYLALIRHYDTQITTLEVQLKKLTKERAGRDYPLLPPTPGIGEYLGLTILHELGDIARFPTVKDFLSYCRLVKGTVASAGQIKGLRGAKLGSPYLRWAFGEAAVIAKRDPAVLGPLAQRLEARMNGNKFKANTVLAIKLARAVYFMLRNHTVFDPDRLVAALSKN